MKQSLFWRAVCLGFLLLALAGFVGCQSKPEEKVITVGVVSYSPAMNTAYEGFKKQMEEFGYEEGVNIRYIYDRPAENQEELLEFAQSLVDQGVDLILALATPSALAAKEATAESPIPVVFVPATDPVGSKLVESLSHPDGNLTGVTNLSSETLRLDWLIDVVDTKILTKIYIPYNPNDKSALFALGKAQDAAPDMGLEIVPAEATNVAEMELALAEMPEDITAIYMLPDSVAISAIQAFVKTALDHKIPLCAPTTTQVKAGALISYGLDLESASKQAARLAYQILQGKNPGDLPVEESEFYLAINLATAKAIELDITDSIINQADFIYDETTE